MSDRDFSAIASWERMPQGDELGRSKPCSEGRSLRYVCECGRQWVLADAALQHHVETTHQVRLVYRPRRNR